MRVDDLLWVDRDDADAFRRGRIRFGDRWVTFAEADAVEKTPEAGYLLRTDHVVLRTNVAFARAEELARAAERHVEAVLAVFGDALSLHLPEDPLRVVCCAKRSEFQRLLASRVSDAVDWGAFYLAADGTVYASNETRGEGGLPTVADLRHEMTHAILDLGRPDDGRARMFSRPQFWLWEAAAIASESLSDPPGARAGEERHARFLRRRAWGEWTPLRELMALPQSGFEGRHYDEVASFSRWLLDADGGVRRPRVFALLARVMDGWGEVDDFERYVGLSPDEAERRWLASLGPIEATPASVPVGR